MEIRGRRKTDNKGSALVVVIIAMAFIGILASVLMYMSLLNYQMKVNNLKAKDNFYSAETVLDEIRSYMGTQISESVGNAYENCVRTVSGEGSNPECRSVWRTVGGIDHHAWRQSDQGRQ